MHSWMHQGTSCIVDPSRAFCCRARLNTALPAAISIYRVGIVPALPSFAQTKFDSGLSLIASMTTADIPVARQWPTPFFPFFQLNYANWGFIQIVDKRKVNAINCILLLQDLFILKFDFIFLITASQTKMSRLSTLLPC